MLKKLALLWCDASFLIYLRDFLQGRATRGNEPVQGMMFATLVLEDLVPANHPLRELRRLMDPILRDISPQLEALDR